MVNWPVVFGPVVRQNMVVEVYGRGDRQAWGKTQSPRSHPQVIYFLQLVPTSEIVYGPCLSLSFYCFEDTP